MAKLSYKFVNPGLTSKDKETLKVAGVKSGSKTKLPSGKIVLGLNRIGLTLEGIGQTIKGLKSIEEVRAISLRDREVEERRADRDRQLDQKENSQERGRVGGKVDEKKLKDETKRKHGAKIKKAGGFLQQLLQPLWNLISPFISFAAVMGVLKWFQDEKNQEKVKKLVEFAGVVFKFLYDWATFGISALLDGFANLFGGMSKIQKGELGGVWDTIMGFGQLLVGFLALKGLAMFMNPFSLMGGILDMLNVLSSDTPELPDKPDKPDKPDAKGLKKKTWLSKMRQRIRIMFKRLKGRWLKKVLFVFGIVGTFLTDLASKVAAWGAEFFTKRVKPLIDKAVAKAIEAFKKSLPPNVLKSLGDGLDAVKKGGADILKRADDLTKPLIEGASKVIDTTKNIIADPRQALSEAKQTLKKEVGGRATDLFKWFQSTKFGQKTLSAAGAVKGAWDVTSAFAIEQYKNFKGGVDKFIKQVTELPQTVSNQWNKLAEGVTELAKNGKDFVVDKFLSPLKAGAEDLIKNTPIGKFFVDQFAGKAGKEGGEGLFKKFVKMAKPGVIGVKNALDAAPFKIGPLDIIVDALFAAMDLKAGQDPRRVALRLTGSILGLIAGTAILGAIGAGTGGIGAAILAGVVTGATQWGGEWLADKLADMIGIPKKDVTFLDAFNIDEKKIDEASNAETPQASAGGLIRGVKMSMGGAVQPEPDNYDPAKKYKVGDIVTKDGEIRVFDGMGWGAYTPGLVTSQGNVTQTLQGTSTDSFEKAGTEKGSNDSGLASLAVLQAKGDDGFGGAAHKLLQAFAALFPGITLSALKPAKEKADGNKSTPGSGSPPTNETGKPSAAQIGGGFDEKFAAVLGNYEGLKLEAYKDANYGWEIPTIGIGATYYPPGFRLSGKVKRGDTITEKEAYEIKAKHIIEHRQRLVNELGSADLYNKVPNNVKVALESKVFNYGSMGSTLKGIVKSSIASGDYKSVASHFRSRLARHNGGINSWRRNDEAGIIETGKSNRTGIEFQKASTGGRIHMAAGGMIQSSKTVAIQHEAEESEIIAIPVPKMIPMPINRTQGVTVKTVVSGASDNSIRFENY